MEFLLIALVVGVVVLAGLAVNFLQQRRAGSIKAVVAPRRPDAVEQPAEGGPAEDAR